jgi:hypothetical protein
MPNGLNLGPMAAAGSSAAELPPWPESAQDAIRRNPTEVAFDREADPNRRYCMDNFLEIIDVLFYR